MTKEQVKKWDRSSLKDPHALMDKRERVRGMFSSIAGSYDLMNHVLSLNLDRLWRRRVVSISGAGAGESVLDVCCGTGDLTFQFASSVRGLGQLVGVDFSQEMLEVARRKEVAGAASGRNGRHKGCNIKWICADAEDMPFADEHFDCACCAFGIRNLQDLSRGLGEINRVLKRGGRMVILEFSLPENRLLLWIYECYFRLVLPIIGSMISQDRCGAYQYLPESVRSFKTAGELNAIIEEQGFRLIRNEKRSFGVVRIFVGEKKQGY